MKKLVIATMTAVLVGAAFAQARGTTRRAGASVSTKKPAAAAAAEAEEDVTTGKAAKVIIDQFPKTGRPSTLSAPALAGASLLPQCYTKPRKWIVLETKYSTFVPFQDQLTFTWHVLLETKSATENKGNKEGIAPYSYFTTSTTYYNIPKGSHAASVCLHPSYLERYGEPKAIGLVITNAKGEVLGGDCEAEGGELKSFHHPKSLESAFWNDQKVMNATQPNGDPMIERRQGLVDRSKTIWALVNPNDYEYVAQ